MEQVFCQSCAMPMTPDLYGSEADGAPSAKYCKYCYQNGAFTADVTMDEMIAFCVKPMVEHNPGMTPEQARAMMQEAFVHLERWRTKA